MNWFERLMPSRIRTESTNKRAVPEGLWAKCPGCGGVLYRAELERNLEVCPKCGHHSRLGARRRLDHFLDPDGREEIAPDLESLDPLKFKDLRKYKDRLAQAQKETDEKEALVVMRGRLKGLDLVAAAFEFEFMGGSMGSVVGERFFVVEGATGRIEGTGPLQGHLTIDEFDDVDSSEEVTLECGVYSAGHGDQRAEGEVPAPGMAGLTLRGPTSA